MPPHRRLRSRTSRLLFARGVSRYALVLFSSFVLSTTRVCFIRSFLRSLFHRLHVIRRYFYRRVEIRKQLDKQCRCYCFYTWLGDSYRSIEISWDILGNSEDSEEYFLIFVITKLSKFASDKMCHVMLNVIGTSERAFWQIDAAALTVMQLYSCVIFILIYAIQRIYL